MLGACGLAGVADARCTDPRVPDARAAIDQTCTCTGNHGQYVSCVARAVREAVAKGEVDVTCNGAGTRCAARSTCAHTTASSPCAICDPGTCTEGTCDDGVTVCADSSQCPPGLNRCSTKASQDACIARGGVVGDGSCCDVSCVVP